MLQTWDKSRRGSTPGRRKTQGGLYANFSSGYRADSLPDKTKAKSSLAPHYCFSSDLRSSEKRREVGLTNLHVVSRLPFEQVLPRTHMPPDNYVDVFSREVHKRCCGLGREVHHWLFDLYKYALPACVKVNIVVCLSRPHLTHVFLE